jgi:MarR family transcriptional regulator, organic hydroperoxide resistance regulator
MTDSLAARHKHCDMVTRTTDRPLSTSRSELMPDGTDREFRILVHNFLIFAERIQSIRNGLAQVFGLTGVQYTIVTALAHLSGEDGVSVSSVAKHLRVTGSFITMSTAALVDSGLLAKRPDGEDRRKVRLTLTAKGLKLLRKISSVQQPVNDALFEGLSRSDFRLISKSLSELIDSADHAQALLKLLAVNRSAG